MPIVTPRVLVELNGADPVHIVTNLPAIVVDVLDWDDVREGGEDALSSRELISIHDEWEKVSPNTARSIRDELRKRDVKLPPEYDHETR